MRGRSGRFNAKRRIRDEFGADDRLGLCARVGYGGNPEHKRNPGDFGLTPSAQPRADKSLCDNAAIFTRAEALVLVRDGIHRGLVSIQEVNGLPQNIWSVTSGGIPLEAQLENAGLATYHGYPLTTRDPFRSIVFKAW